MSVISFHETLRDHSYVNISATFYSSTFNVYSKFCYGSLKLIRIDVQICTTCIKKKKRPRLWFEPVQYSLRCFVQFVSSDPFFGHRAIMTWNVEGRKRVSCRIQSFAYYAMLRADYKFPRLALCSRIVAFAWLPCSHQNRLLGVPTADITFA